MPKNCIKHMMLKFHGNRVIFTLGSAKGFLLGVGHRWFRNVGGDSHGEWGKSLCIYVKFWNSKTNFEVQNKNCVL